MKTIKAGEAKSVCKCGHVGDGEFESRHAGFNGHGACMITGCSCPQFSWVRFRKGYSKKLSRAIRVGDKLANGATLVAEGLPDRDGWKAILALRVEDDGVAEYVIWNMSPDGETQSGSYCLTFGDALIEFNRRKEGR